MITLCKRCLGWTLACEPFDDPDDSEVEGLYECTCEPYQDVDRATAIREQLFNIYIELAKLWNSNRDLHKARIELLWERMFALERVLPLPDDNAFEYDGVTYTLVRTGSGSIHVRRGLCGYMMHVSTVFVDRETDSSFKSLLQTAMTGAY